MQLTILGAAGVRTPLVLESIIARQDDVGLSHLVLMDVDPRRLELMQALCTPQLERDEVAFQTIWTTDPRLAIRGADFIITTFRVGGMESRVIDEQVPLNYGVLGQETTGPGGFSMALRTIPVLLEYVQIVKDEAPEAWFLNFTNPAGIITETIANVTGYKKAVGICDNPSAMWRSAAFCLDSHPEELLVEYFGLNHLGWIRSVLKEGSECLPQVLDFIKANPNYDYPGLPPVSSGYFHSQSMLPNEYNYFYYDTQTVLANLKRAGQCRAQQVMPFNIKLFENLEQLYNEGASQDRMQAAYMDYLEKRNGTYMSLETGHIHNLPELGQSADPIGGAAEGYSGVALDVVQALQGKRPALIILNTPNHGAIHGMGEEDVVEVTCFVGHGAIKPLAVGRVPEQALELMQRIKEYERLTIQTALNRSSKLAIQALATHPLVPSPAIAKEILADYVQQHGQYFPELR
jgi:6-phospho-beta-glucosidase